MITTTELQEQIKDFAETNRLLTRAARRCVRDMSHMLQEIKDPFYYNLYSEQLKMWHSVFWDSSGYRDQLHLTINQLTLELECAKRKLKDLGVSEELPF